MAKDKLVTSGYCLILAANFLLYFAFYLILPVLPFYLTEVFHTGNAAVGVILYATPLPRSAYARFRDTCSTR